MAEAGTPEYLFNPDDWECTYNWKDRCEAVDDLPVGELQRFCTLTKGPDKWAANVVITRDEAGDPDDTEIQWFDTEAEARKAMGLPPYLTEG